MRSLHSTMNKIAVHFDSAGLEKKHSKTSSPSCSDNWMYQDRLQIVPGSGSDIIAVGKRVAGRAKGTGIVRLWYSGDHIVPPARLDAVSTMEEGVQVLFYSPTNHGFERRVVKVDNKLDFLFIMDTKDKNKGNPPFAVRITQIIRLADATDALKICEGNGIIDKTMSLENVLAVQFSTDPEVVLPPLDKVFVFLSAPQQQLRECIELCIHERFQRPIEADFPKQENKTSMVRELAGGMNRKLAEVNGAILEDISQVFDNACPDLILQVLLKPDNTPLTLRARNVDKQRCYDTIGQMVGGTEYYVQPLDQTRLAFTLRDIVSLKEWAGRIHSAFKNRFWDFINEPKFLAASIPPDAEFQNVVKSAAQQAERREPDAKSKDMGQRLGEASARSSIKALQNFLELEGEYSTLLLRAEGVSRTAGKVSRITLGGLSLTSERKKKRYHDTSDNPISQNELILPATTSRSVSPAPASELSLASASRSVSPAPACSRSVSPAPSVPQEFPLSARSDASDPLRSGVEEIQPVVKSTGVTAPEERPALALLGAALAENTRSAPVFQSASSQPAPFGTGMGLPVFGGRGDSAPPSLDPSPSPSPATHSRDFSPGPPDNIADELDSGQPLVKPKKVQQCGPGLALGENCVLGRRANAGCAGAGAGEACIVQ